MNEIESDLPAAALSAAPGATPSMKCGSRTTAKRPPSMNAGSLMTGGETTGAIQERTTTVLSFNDCLDW